VVFVKMLSVVAVMVLNMAAITLELEKIELEVLVELVGAVFAAKVLAVVQMLSKDGQLARG
jgi:hypothetical protein